MKRLRPDETTERIAAIIHNQPLASAVHRSVASALDNPVIRLVERESEWKIFERSLSAAIRDIETHPRGKLFRRLLEYGPHHPDDPESPTSDGRTVLSDPECGQCVEFIYSHMVNRFKGELAELLAVEPCLGLTCRLQKDRVLPADVSLYWGDTIQERRRTRIVAGGSGVKWGGFAKGADGLIVEQRSSEGPPGDLSLKVHGIVEIKSMPLSRKKILAQMERHALRLRGGVRLAGKVWPAARIDHSGGLRVMVLPSSWRLSRKWYSEPTGQGRRIVLPEPQAPPTGTQFIKLNSDVWKIKLAWSHEAIEQAAYEMTFWYMSQVGNRVYAEKALPKGWEAMTAEAAGYNAIKMMLYYMPLRCLPRRQGRLAVKLYNIYSFGYPLGADSKDMLWPEDFGGRGSP